MCAVNNPSANNMNAFGSNSAVSADETTLVVGAWAEEVVKQGIDYEYAGAVYLYDVNLDYLLLGVNAVQMVWPVPPIPIPESHINPAAITQVATATTQAEVPPLKRGATAGGQE